MKCPTCGSDYLIVLVHSLRVLCANCLHQWSPDVPLDEVLGAAELAEALRGTPSASGGPVRPAPSDPD